MAKVNHPNYYVKNGIEVLDVIEAFGLNFSRGNILKYVCRAGFKNPEKELEDLEKCKVYIEREIERIKREKMIQDVEKSPLYPVYGEKHEAGYSQDSETE